MARVKLFLHENYDDVESVWGTTCGRARGGTLVRIDNIPYVHSKPTFGDVVVAKRDRELDVPYAWNVGQNGKSISEKKIIARLHEDAGRYAGIVEYAAKKKGASFARLTKWLRKEHDVVSEGAWEGTLYLAIPKKLRMKDLMRATRARFADAFRFKQVHP